MARRYSATSAVSVVVLLLVAAAPLLPEVDAECRASTSLACDIDISSCNKWDDCPDVSGVFEVKTSDLLTNTAVTLCFEEVPISFSLLVKDRGLNCPNPDPLPTKPLCPFSTLVADSCAGPNSGQQGCMVDYKKELDGTWTGDSSQCIIVANVPGWKDFGGQPLSNCLKVTPVASSTKCITVTQTCKPAGDKISHVGVGKLVCGGCPCCDTCSAPGKRRMFF